MTSCQLLLERWCTDLKISCKSLIAIFAALVVSTSTIHAETDGGTDTPTEVEVTSETQDVNKGEEAVEGEESSTVEEEVTTENAEVTGTEQIENRPIYAEDVNGVIDGHEMIASNQRLELYLEKESLSLIVRNKKTSALMYSTVQNPDESNNKTWQDFMKSGVSLEYLTGSNVNVNKVSMFTDGITKDIKVNAQGFTADIYVPSIEIGFTLSVTLTESGIVAEVLEESIIEGDTHKVSGFYLYPFLGYSKLGSRDGYMVIPDGSGAIINLEDNDGEYTQPFSSYIYGQNIGLDEKNVPTLFKDMNIVKSAENILMPIFGMVHTDSQIGVLGIVEGGGEYSSKIEAYPNGAVTAYDWITAKFIYRQSYNQSMSQSTGSIVVLQNERNHFDARIRYEFVSGDDATYTGLAKCYRDYLIETGELEQKAEEFRMRLDFLGLEQKDGMLSKENVVMTTVEDIKTIYADLENSGVENVLSVYKGWQKGGVSTGLPLTNFKTDSSLGGNSELKELLDSLEDSSIDLYLYHDPLRMDASINSLLKYSVVKKLNKRVYEESTYKSVVETYNYLLPSKVSELLDKLESKYAQNNISNLMVSGISNNIFSYSLKGKITDRVQTASDFEQMVSQYQESFNLLLEQPFSYMWKYTDVYMDTPLTGSNYNFTAENIPFLAIVLKGYVPMYSEYINFEANKTENFLNMIEQGVLPSFYLTMEDPAELVYTNSSDIYSSRYDLYKDEVVKYYNELQEFYQMIEGATIENHSRLDDVAVVEYSNGLKVYVNYSSKTKSVDGVTIDALSYKVGGVS